MLMRQIVIFVVLLIASIQIEAQEVIVKPSQVIGAANIISVTATDGIQAMNPSIMAEAEGFNATVSYTRPYNISELQQVMGKAVYETSFGNIEAQINQSGSTDSRYTEIGGGFSRKFNKWAIGMEYYAIIHKLPNNQSYTSSFSRVGLHYHPIPQWTISVFVHNVERRSLDYEYSSYALEPMASVGLRWNASRIFTFLCEAQKNWDSDAEGKVAVCIVPYKNLHATFGFSSLGSSLTAGVGYTYSNIDIHVGIAHHNQLGVTSSASIGVRNLWGKNK